MERKAATTLIWICEPSRINRMFHPTQKVV
jgi:hypothetical protein